MDIVAENSDEVADMSLGMIWQWRPSLHIYSGKLQEDEGGKRWKKHTDRVFPSSACEPLDQKHMDRVFPCSACEPLDQVCVIG